jgi:RimJ/RimL family protein N-acetyltransferase
MPNWITAATELSGELVQLVPLKKKHIEPLVHLGKDERIWTYYSLDGTDGDRLRAALNAGIAAQKSGTQFPFVIFEKNTNAVIGSTRFLEIQQPHRKLEIGWTWLHPDYWGTAINLECKLLLLTFCFETLGTARVQFRTDENNIRSWKAIEKIGAKFEGILRHDIIRDNGTNRNSPYFSILDTEWALVKQQLTEKYLAKKG